MVKGTSTALASVLLLSLIAFSVSAPLASAADEICNYQDDDGDGKCFGGSNNGNVCYVAGDCPSGICATIDEDFTYQGIRVGNTCNGVGECGLGGVYCSSTTTAECSTNPGAPEYDGSAEVCNGLDDNCDSINDNGGSALCDNGAWCDGSETCGGVVGCQAGTAPSCADTVACTTDACDEATDSCGHTANDALCNDGAWCNGAETCNVATGCVAGTTVDCSWNNLAAIATCLNVPDSNPFTWDFFTGFVSACNEATDSCTSGSVSLTHTCDVTDCGAECDATHPCQYARCLSNCTCTLPGDVNGDWKVDIKDLAAVGKAYGSVPGGGNWNANADFNGDGRISLMDLVIVGKNYGRSG
jgi:hypothetical protein